MSSTCIQVNLGNVCGTFFCGFYRGWLQNYKSRNTVYVRVSVEVGSGNGGGWVLSLRGLPKLNKSKQEVRQVQIWGILL